MLYQRTGMPLHPCPLCPKSRGFTSTAETSSTRLQNSFPLRNTFFTNCADYSTASGRGLFNVSDLAWDEEALDPVPSCKPQASTLDRLCFPGIQSNPKLPAIAEMAP